VERGGSGSQRGRGQAAWAGTGGSEAAGSGRRPGASAERLVQRPEAGWDTLGKLAACDTP